MYGFSSIDEMPRVFKVELLLSAKIVVFENGKSKAIGREFLRNDNHTCGTTFASRVAEARLLVRMPVQFMLSFPEIMLFSMFRGKLKLRAPKRWNAGKKRVVGTLQRKTTTVKDSGDVPNLWAGGVGGGGATRNTQQARMKQGATRRNRVLAI